MAVASATQDIVIDAFRVESLDDDQQAAGVACYVAAYRVAMLVATAGVIALVAMLEHRGVSVERVWAYGYWTVGALVLVGSAAALAAREPASSATANTGTGSPMDRLWNAAVEAFSDFLTKPHVLTVLAFVVLFKFCDAFAGVMTGPFIIKIGFDKEAYAAIVKGVGTAATLAGGVAGGLIARALPMGYSLWIAGIVQMASNLMFSWQAYAGVDHALLTATVVVENFTGGIGTVIFVSYLSGLCTSPAHTATQFAILTAFAAVGRTALSALSGYVADYTGWFWFFVASALVAVPALALLASLQAQGHFRPTAKEIQVS